MSGILSTYLSIYMLFLFLNCPYISPPLLPIVYSLCHCLKYLFLYLPLVSRLNLQVYCMSDFFLIRFCRAGGGERIKEWTE